MNYRAPQRFRVPKKDIAPKRTKRPPSWFIEEKKAADEAYRTNYDQIFKKEQDVSEIKLPPPSPAYRSNYDEIFRKSDESEVVRDAADCGPEALACVIAAERVSREQLVERYPPLPPPDFDRAAEVVAEARKVVAINEATGRPLGRFDQVRYDETAQAQQTQFKQACIDLEKLTNGLESPYWKEKALYNLELFYMCIGKAIRDDQVERTGSAPLQEERVAS